MSNKENSCSLKDKDVDELMNKAKKFDEKWTNISISSYDVGWIPATVKEIQSAMNEGLPSSVVEELVQQTEQMFEDFNEDLNDMIGEFKRTRDDLLSRIYTLTERYINQK